MLEPIKRFIDFIVDIPVAWSELIAKHMEDSKIDFVGSLCICGVYFRKDVGRIVEQDVEHIVAFMLVRSDDLDIDGDMVRYQGVGDDPFFSPKYFGEWRALIVWMRVSNFCPSLLECRVSPIS